MDVNGYYIADKWSSRHALKQIGIYERLMKYDSKLIMMPKSYGPFNKKRKNWCLFTLIINGNVVFARYKLSYECFKVNNE